MTAGNSSLGKQTAFKMVIGDSSSTPSDKAHEKTPFEKATPKHPGKMIPPSLKPTTTSIEEDSVQEDDWSHIMTTDLSAGSFAQHDVQEIDLGTKDGKRRPLRIASTDALSPLDMMDLSWGTNDATGHRIWMGANMFLQALPHLEKYFGGPNSRQTWGRSRCLELGSGTGLGGIALALYFGPSCISECYLTDNSESALRLCRENCQRNSCLTADPDEDHHPNENILMFVQHLEWGNSLSGAPSSKNSHSKNCGIFDVVVATDVLYDIGAWKPLLATARASLEVGGHWILSHVPRAALPSPCTFDDDKDDGAQTHCKASSGTNKETRQSYPAALEAHLIKTAQLFDLLLKARICPQELQAGQSAKIRAELQDMKEAGASVLVFERRT